MATKEAIAIQRNAELDRIEARMAQLVSPNLTPIPRVYRDMDILWRDQLHIIADWLDRIPDTAADPRLQQALAVMDNSKWTKADMEAVLRGDHDANE